MPANVGWAPPTILILLASSTWAQVPRPKPAPPKQVVEEIRVDQKLGDQIPLDLSFRDDAGQTVQLSQYFRNKPVILSLVYYRCPQLCGMTLNGMSAAFKALTPSIGKDFDVVTVSFDPKETPDLAAAKKQSYVKQYNRPDARSGWHFLTGDESSIRALTSACGFFYHYDPRTGQYAHASVLMVLTPDGRLSRYFYGVEFSARDLGLGLVEASSGKIGTIAEKIMLLCYEYDPRSGKYGFAIITALRTGGILTVLALCTFWLVMFRRERRGRANGAHVTATAHNGPLTTDH